MDKNVESILLDPKVDIIGMAAKFKRQEELLHYYRARGYYVFAGGSHARLRVPGAFRNLADTIIVDTPLSTYGRISATLTAETRC